MSNKESDEPIEYLKYGFDYCKHITTLDTSAILLMVAFLDKAFEHPKMKGFAVFAFVCFSLSLICSVNTIYNFMDTIRRREFMLGKIKSGIKLTVMGMNFLVSKYGFIIGMISLSIFAVMNLVG